MKDNKPSIASPRSNDGITLFRCCLMFLVVLHHAICYSSNSQTLPMVALWLLTVPAVDGFLSISGWYGMHFSWRKVGGVLGQIVFYAALSSAVSFPLAWIGWLPSPIVAMGCAWYGLAYLALLCLCPILNAGIEAVRREGRSVHAATAILAVFFVDWASRAFHLGLSVNGFGSHTILTFVALYCGIGLLKPVLESHRRFVVVIGLLAFLAYELIFCGRSVFFGTSYVVDIVGEYGFYNCPLVICSAMSAFLVFAAIRPPILLARIVRFAAPSMFGVYLISEASPVFKQIFLSKLIRPYGVFVGACSVFLVCIVIDLVVRRLPLWLMKKGATR